MRYFLQGKSLLSFMNSIINMILQQYLFVEILNFNCRNKLFCCCVCFISIIYEHFIHVELLFSDKLSFFLEQKFFIVLIQFITKRKFACKNARRNQQTLFRTQARAINSWVGEMNDAAEPPYLTVTGYEGVTLLFVDLL